MQENKSAKYSAIFCILLAINKVDTDLKNCEKYEFAGNFFEKNYGLIELTDDESHKETINSLASQCDQFEKICKKIQSNYKDNEINTNKQLEKLQQEIREFDTLFNHKIEQGLTFTQDLRQNTDSLCEINRDYCFKITRETIQFNDQDYEEYIQTGKSPKQKEKNKVEEISDPKTNDELLKNFRLSAEDLKQSLNATSSEALTASFHLSSNFSRPSKNEIQHGFKRGISDKENLPDLSEKASKYK
ncbi:hypothetical protein BpHYR1_014264 [Brachionus plicatilis]|uniref:Uncharacterized protein n=1 Tax=Brachionus plicatilis TaxID=10195 RepID=A0A3M7SVU0_BRAPC|nr:hypothetical protein BpHYR1_014264 [Brachionus plicatilis]